MRGRCACRSASNLVNVVSGICSELRMVKNIWGQPGEPGRPPKAKRRSREKRVDFETVRQLALALPGVEEGTSYGSPAFRVGGKMLARFHQDGESLVVRIELAAREVLIGAAPETFYVTDHYRCYPLMLVRVSSVDREDLRNILEEAWRRSAPKRLVAARETGGD